MRLAMLALVGCTTRPSSQPIEPGGAEAGGEESCDGADDDGDGAVDEGLLEIYYRDGDGDTYGAGSGELLCHLSPGYVVNHDDCDDSEPSVYPGGAEVCDELDNDCDGAVDDEAVSIVEEEMVLSTAGEIESFCEGRCGNAVLESGLYISDTDAEDLDALACITSIQSHLYIYRNSELVSIEGLSGLTVGDSDYLRLQISGNPKLRSVDGLAGIARLQGLHVVDNAEIADLRGLSSLAQVSGEVLITDNPSLQEIGTSSLTSVANSVYIQNNESLSSLHGLEALEDMGGSMCDHHYITYNRDFLIGDNPALESLAALSSLRQACNLSIYNNDGLRSLAGLDALTTIGGPGGGGLAISSNDSLESLEALSGVTEVYGYLGVQSNGSLQDLDGLESLQRVLATDDEPGWLAVEGNAALADVAALGAVEIASDLTIKDNASLPTADAEAAAAGCSVGGQVIIEGNAP